jgi:hypothetical protein
MLVLGLQLGHDHVPFALVFADNEEIALVGKVQLQPGSISSGMSFGSYATSRKRKARLLHSTISVYDLEYEYALIGFSPS